MKPVKLLYALVLAFLFLPSAPALAADQFTIVVMQDDRDAAKKYKPLKPYLAKKGIILSIVETPNYSTAAHRFNAGRIDAMFSGSGVAGIFILKGLAVPLVRPVSKDGASTYHAVILAPKGSPPFTGSADYFRKKRVAFPSLASAGEIYFRSISKNNFAQIKILKMSSHGAAVDALAKGAADMALVKNPVWEKYKDDYPNIAAVGEDEEENPDGTLIVSMKSNRNTIEKVSGALLALKKDDSPEAKAARDQMDIRGYIRTTPEDFKHTFELLHRAGIDKSFDFRF